MNVTNDVLSGSSGSSGSLSEAQIVIQTRVQVYKSTQFLN